MTLVLLDPETPDFPNPTSAAKDPDGLLAVGGNLAPSTILNAYSMGIFPWYNDQDPILWWSPSIRCVIYPDQLHISKSLKKYIRKHPFSVTIDRSFHQVIRACAERGNSRDTWITSDMISAYTELHSLGHAHSLEVWENKRLIGGIYGLAVGAVFCGESMFSHATNGSKIAMLYLCQHLDAKGFKLLDCQLANEHLLTMGGQTMKRGDFLSQLAALREQRIDWL